MRILQKPNIRRTLIETDEKQISPDGIQTDVDGEFKQCLKIMGVRRGVSKGVEDGRRPSALWVGYP
jgi:hypothetical protein